MGNWLSDFFDWATGAEEASILILGLDASGKTTIINRLKTNENKVTVPTIGFNVEHLQFGNLSFVAWDIGGQNVIRKLWHNYFENANAVVFVIDSSDQKRFSEVRRELQNLTQHRALKLCPFLIFANKQDLPKAADTNTVVNKLGLFDLMRHREWKVCESTATSGSGINRGFEWLSTQL